MKKRNTNIYSNETVSIDCLEDEKFSRQLFSMMNHQVEILKSESFILKQMELKGIDTFSKALVYVMDELNDPRITKEYLAKFIGVSTKTIQNYRNDKTIPDTIERVMLICLGCRTGPEVSKFLINKGIGGIPDSGFKKIAYELLLKYTDTSLEFWNMILDEFDLPYIYPKEKRGK